MHINTNCPCCKKQNIKNISTHKGYVHFGCAECEHEFFISNSVNRLDINQSIYKGDSDYSNDLKVSTDYNSLIQWNHLKAFNFIKKMKGIKSILDVGTYNGFFVKYLRERGYEAYGYDFNNEAIEMGINTYGLKGMITTKLNEIPFNKFDCITSLDVIEHLEYPQNFIEQISLHLHDEGYLVLSCPNNKMIWRPPLDYPPHHLSRYSPKSLRIFIEGLGFMIIKTTEQMSTFDLIRNFAGTFFRDKKKDSLKGGQFKYLIIVNILKNILNKSRKFFYLSLFLFDFILSIFGFRYISQVSIAKKIKTIEKS